MFIVNEEEALGEAGPVDGAEVEAKVFDGVGSDVNGP